MRSETEIKKKIEDYQREVKVCQELLTNPNFNPTRTQELVHSIQTGSRTVNVLNWVLEKKGS